MWLLCNNNPGIWRAIWSIEINLLLENFPDLLLWNCLSFVLFIRDTNYEDIRSPLFTFPIYHLIVIINCIPLPLEWSPWEFLTFRMGSRKYVFFLGIFLHPSLSFVAVSNSCLYLFMYGVILNSCFHILPKIKISPWLWGGFKIRKNLSLLKLELLPQLLITVILWFSNVSHLKLVLEQVVHGKNAMCPFSNKT